MYITTMQTQPTTPAILSAAKTCASKGYAGEAWISDVAAELGMSVAALAPALFSGMQAGEIRLNRADLTGAMPADKLRASEVQHPMLRSASYHRVVVG